ncbi:glycosyltransferase family 39 protein [Marinobacterium sp. xm-a-152]|uniref:ArnT family glycosyltransferase n=1 Tax=Marinobacterium sp. xm-a-152 TaxID=2497733 RepID=UPI001568D1DD|nr:glycosyltransferase family 39 protein [Marinobacterium sp. xm-a-152]NRP15749.1 Undecaprenyl phosphate-alpha-4-amino-4-deoxy-L-arabinose arabinosyl transferase [Marinobacterium sp. xm-a-152]
MLTLFRDRSFQFLLFAAAILFAYREWITQSAPIHLFFDEAYYYGWSQSLDWGYYSKPPMVAWLIRLTTDLFGSSEWAIKLASPLLYSITSLILFSIGQRLHSTRAGLYAGLLFLTMPLVSFNSLFITTDAPLLFFWTLALLLFLKAQQSNQWVVWMAAGIVGGLGLLSKYTFILFPAGFLVYAAISKEGRELLANPRFWVACGIAILLLLPNLWWNYQHDFISFQHTAEISQQSESSFSIVRLIEFLATQLAVVGPVSALALFASTFMLKRVKGTKLLWAIFIPIFLVISFQALSARANINWGAPAYITGVLLVAILLSLRNSHKILTLAVSINLLLMIGFYHYTSIQKGLGFEPTPKNNPYSRIQGWYELSEEIAPSLAQYPELIVASESRKVAAYFGFYRDPKNLNARALDLDNHIKSHYELLYPVSNEPEASFLFLSERMDAKSLERYFNQAVHLDYKKVTVMKGLERQVYVTLVRGFKDDN